MLCYGVLLHGENITYEELITNKRTIKAQMYDTDDTKMSHPLIENQSREL